MSTINERNWEMFREVRKELGLDKVPDPEVEPPEIKKFHRFRDPKTGELISYEHDRPKLPNLQNAFPPRPGEVCRSEWISREAARSGLTVNTVRHKLDIGDYDSRITIRKVHHRLNYISEKATP